MTTEEIIVLSFVGLIILCATIWLILNLRTDYIINKNTKRIPKDLTLTTEKKVIVPNFYKIEKMIKDYHMTMARNQVRVNEFEVIINEEYFIKFEIFKLRKMTLYKNNSTNTRVVYKSEINQFDYEELCKKLIIDIRKNWHKEDN